MSQTKVHISQLSGVQPETINLIAIAATAPDPTAYAIGDKYSDTVTNKVYTVYDNAGTHAWDAGVNHVGNVIYLDTSTYLIYQYNGTKLQQLGNSGIGNYKGTWSCTGATDYSALTVPAKKGDFYLVSGTTTIDTITYTTSDFISLNKDVDSGSIVTADIEFMDIDLVLLNAAQTLTNKTIDANSNTLTNIHAANVGTSFKTDASIFVDKNRLDSYTADGSSVKPFKTIQAAVDYVASLDTANYVTINIADGVYAENIVLEDLKLRNIWLRGNGYVSIAPTTGNALQSTANNTNLNALHINSIIFAKPVVITGANATTAFMDVIWTDVSFTATGTLTASCMNNLTLRNAYVETTISVNNIYRINIQDSQLQNQFNIGADSTVDAPSQGTDVTMQVFGCVLLGKPVYTIGGTATYTLAITGTRWGVNEATTIASGFTVYATAAFIRGSVTNNGLVYLRSAFVENYIAGTGSINILANASSQIAFTPTGGISAATVQSAIAELDTDKLDKTGDGSGLTAVPNFVIQGNTQYGETLVTNLDTITKAGFYICYGTATGVPNSTYSWFVQHQNSSVGTTSATQRAVAFNKDELLVYERVKTSSVWGNWLRPSATSNSNIPFSIKSANIGDKGEVDLFNISKFVNSGCSFTGAVATGGSGKYVRLLETAPISTADSWVINVPKFNFTSVGSSGGALNGYSGNLDFQVPLLLIDSATNHLLFLASSAGTSWDIFAGEDTGLILSTATDYYIRLSYDSVNGYEIEYSTDGVNYTSAWTSATTTKSFCNSPFMFMNSGLETANYFVAGTMDLSTGSITIDSEEWWNGADLSNSLTFKVDDGTLYSDLKVIGIDGQEHTLNTLSAVDVSSIADGEIKIVITETGAEARKNKIFVQTAEPTPENDGDIWIKGNEAFDWDNSESEWVTSTVIAVLGVITKNGLIENGYCFPLNYNGKSEMNCFSYVSGVVEYDLTAKTGFKFYGRYKDNLIPGAHPVKFSKFYDTNYSGILAGGITEADSAGYILATSTDIFKFQEGARSNNIILQGYLTKN